MQPLLFALFGPLLLGASVQEVDAERGLVLNTDGAAPGYTLFPPLRSETTYLIDMEGRVVHTWDSDYSPGNSAYLLDDGSLLRACRMDNDLFSGGGQGGRLQQHDWDGALLWDFEFSNDTHMHHHDFEPLPNGNVLLIAWESMETEDAIALGRDPAQIGEKGFWPDFVVEIEPLRPNGGKVVWEWHAADHLIQDFDPDKAGYGDVTAHPELIDINGDHRDQPPLSEAERERLAEVEREMQALGYTGDDEEEEADDAKAGEEESRRRAGDWLHTNGIDYHPELDLIVLSVRRMHEIWIIDHSTSSEEAAGHTGGRYGRGGDLLYRWGNPRLYGQGSAADRQLFGQHDATFVPGEKPGVPHVLLFNNGEGRPGGNFSSVDEIALPFDPEQGFAIAEGALDPKEPCWSYRAPEKESFFSSFISGTQRLPNGNTLICSGVQGRFFEVTRDGEVVWDYLNPFGKPKPEETLPDAKPEAPGGVRGPRPGRRTRRGLNPKALFRGIRIALDHPGLAGRELIARTDLSAPSIPATVEPGTTAGIRPLHTVGKLALGGQPNPAALDELAQAGLELVIDLRRAGELTDFNEPELVRQLGVEYAHLGFQKPEEMTNEMLADARRLLREHADEPVLMHCASSNRVGAVWLAYRTLDQGVAWDVALEEARRIGLRSEGYETRIRGYVLGPASERWIELKQRIRETFPEVEHVAVEKLAARLQSSATPPLLLDVRTAEEFAVSHLPQARRAETSEEALALLEGVEPAREIVLYCSVGYRSSSLAQELRRAGFENAKNLEGSIFEWANRGHALHRAEEIVSEVHPFDENWGELLERDLWAKSPSSSDAR